MGASVHVRGITYLTSAIPNLASFATPYSSGDVLGSLITLTGAVLDPRGSGVLESIVVLDKDNQKSKIDLYFFDSLLANSPGADNAAYALNVADLPRLLGRVSVADTDYVSSSANAEATKPALGITMKAWASQTVIKPVSESRNLYMLAVSRGTPTYTTASGLIVRVGILQD